MQTLFPITFRWHFRLTFVLKEETVSSAISPPMIKMRMNFRLPIIGCMSLDHIDMKVTIDRREVEK